jgi:hypothetical protein
MIFKSIKETFKSTENLDVIINGIKFHKGAHDTFIVFGQDNKFPFMDAIYDPSSNCWRYRSVFINNEFYIPGSVH